MGYKNTFQEYIEVNYKWEVEIAQKPESTKGFIPQKNRWQVQRSRFDGLIWVAKF